LCIGPTGNPFTVYVAITRAQGREKLLIFRPFDAAPFQKGIGLGRDLLLRHLRGDAINWQALLAKYFEERACSVCTEVSGNAMTRIACAASAQSIMQTSARRGNATCASCGMRRKTFQRNIASVNVVFSVCA